jgi:hypothetical protein
MNRTFLLLRREPTMLSLLLCDEDHERRVEARFQDLLETVDDNPPIKVRPCDVLKLLRSLKMRKSFGIDGIPN